MNAEKLEIVANFRVWVPDGDTGRDRKVEFTRGMVVDGSKVPAGQSSEDWIDKGLAKAAGAASAGKPGAEAGPAV